jgi:hypothetical protein
MVRHFILLLLCFISYGTGIIANISTNTITLGPQTGYFTCVCGTLNISTAGVPCSQVEIYYSVQSTNSQPLNVYFMDTSEAQNFTFGVSHYYPELSCLQTAICTNGWFRIANPDKSLALFNPSFSQSLSVSFSIQTRSVSSSRLAAWVIAVIVISVVIAIVCGAVGLAFKCGWWCWRSATDPARSVQLDGPGVYPANLQMLTMDKHRSSISVLNDRS